MHKKFKIAVFGSAAGSTSEAQKLATELGKEIALCDSILLNGACLGLPDIAARAAHQAGGSTIGYSPARNAIEHKKQGYPVDIYSELIFVPEDFEFSSSIEVARKYRNVLSCASCDAGIIIGGRIGTLNEFTNLFDMKKVIGVLQGTGGIADHISDIVKIANKDSGAIIFNEHDPKILIKKILEVLNQR